MAGSTKITAKVSNNHESASYGAEKALKEPISNRATTTREKIIILKSSKLHGSIFPPWESVPESSEFQCPSDDALFSDEKSFQLSSVQLEVFCCWRRPGETLDDAHASHELKPTMQADGKIDLVQDVTTDCSVVASLCAISARTERGHSDIVICNVHPCGRSQRQPEISANGKYVLKLHFNGCFRKVVIDDRLPASRTSRTLHVVDRNRPGLIWPALVEKAYLKVRGGYDFPGSNSGTDIWVLTGWIPEQLFLQSDDITLNSLWRRIYNAHSYGDVLITMGTGKLTHCEEEELGLAGEHDYAVIDMKELEGQPLLLVKNPWSEGTVWKGHNFRGDAAFDNAQAFEGLRITDATSSGTTQHEPLTPGTFWMSLNDIFQNFESMYLNWNPCLFAHRQHIHFNWDLANSYSPEGSFTTNPQYEVRSSTGATVWMLLSRHFASTSEVSAEAEKAIPSTNTAQGFISLYGFDNDGERIFLNDGAAIHSPYVDSPNTLLKLELPAKRAFTIVVSEQALPRLINTFTLSAYSFAPLSFAEAHEKYAYSTLRHGAWTPSTAGGNASSRLFYLNPQFSITLAETSEVALVLETPAESVPVHVKLVWAGGRKIHSITTRDIVGDSGEYRKGCAFTQIRGVPAGVYTMVCSTFEQGQLGKFTLRVSSMTACTVNQASEGAAGRFVTKLRAAEFTPGVDRLVVPLSSSRLNRISVSARSRGDTSRSERNTHSPLKLSLEYGQGSLKQILSVSGDDEYLDSYAGIRTLDIDVQAKMREDRGVWIALERLGSSGNQSNELVDLELLSDCPVEVGRWAV